MSPALLWAAAGLWLGLAGCNENPPPEPPKEPAPVAAVPAEEQALNARIIEFKNRIQQDAFAADAHFGLGQALFEQGRLTDAETAIGRALELGLDPNLGLPALARVLNLQGRSTALIDKHAGTQLSKPGASAELKAELALAYANTGEARKARAMAEAAIRDDPRSARALVLQAEIMMADGKVDAALRRVEDTLAAHPGSSEAWVAKGDILLLAKGDSAGAAAAFEQALKSSPRHLPTHSKLIALAFAADDPALAKARLQTLARLAPTALPTLYFSARLAQAGGDLAGARQRLQQALASHPLDLRSLQLAAEIELASNALRTAEEHLAKALVQAPGNPRTRQLLARTYLRMGMPEKAQTMLEPLLGGKRGDATSLGLAAESALQSGQTLAATRLYERAAAIDPANPRIRTALAILRIGKGDLAGGFGELEAIVATDRTAHADMALLSERLRARDLPAAIKAAEGVARKQPGKAQPQWLLGRLKLQAGSRDEARGHFLRALELDRAFVPAALALARMDLDAKQPAKARQQLEDVVALSPDQMEALLALAEIRFLAGDPKDSVTASLEKVVGLHPDRAEPRVALITHLIRGGDLQLAQLAAQQAAQAMPNDLRITEMLGRAQIAAGETAQALSTYRRIVTARPRAPEPHLQMAEIYLRRKEFDSAIESLRRGVLLQPQSLPAQTRLAGLLTSNQRWREALRVARDVQRLLPKHPRGLHLEGLVHAAQQQWAPAIAAFQGAMALGESSELVVQYHAALLAAGKKIDADALATRWLGQHPKDHHFIGRLGDIALLNRDFAGAARHYRSILKSDENNVDALNNLAWALTELGDPGALALAQKAAALQPQRAAVLDTLSSALAGANQLEAAIANQKKALALDPDAHPLRLHLARLAIKGKDYALARAELDKLSALGTGFARQNEVWQLRQALP